MTRFYEQTNFWPELIKSMGLCSNAPYIGFLQNECIIKKCVPSTCNDEFKKIYEDLYRLYWTDIGINEKINSKYQILRYYAKKMRNLDLILCEELSQETIIWLTVDLILEKPKHYESAIIFRKTRPRICINARIQTVPFGIPDAQRIADQIDKDGEIVVEIEAIQPGKSKFETAGTLRKSRGSEKFQNTSGIFEITAYEIFEDRIILYFSCNLTQENRITVKYSRKQKADLLDIVDLRSLAIKLTQNNEKIRKVAEKDKDGYKNWLKGIVESSLLQQYENFVEPLPNPPRRDCIEYELPQRDSTVINYDEIFGVAIGKLRENGLASGIYKRFNNWNDETHEKKWQRFLKERIINEIQANWLEIKANEYPKFYSVRRFMQFLMSSVRKHLTILVMLLLEENIAQSCLKEIESNRILKLLLDFNYCECSDNNVLYRNKHDLTDAFNAFIKCFKNKFNAKYCEDLSYIINQVGGVR